MLGFFLVKEYNASVRAFVLLALIHCEIMWTISISHVFLQQKSAFLKLFLMVVLPHSVTRENKQVVRTSTERSVMMHYSVSQINQSDLQ